MSMSCVFVLTLLVGQGSLVEAGDSSKEANLRGLAPMKSLDAKEVESSLLDELASNFRSSISKEHIFEIEKALHPMYVSVPKEDGGNVGHNVARYMLHRFFAERNGWFIRGLEPGTGNSGAAQASDGNVQVGNNTFEVRDPNKTYIPGPANSGTLQDLQEWVPTYLQNFLEQLQGGKGISLRETAIIAATLEDLIHKESISHLERAYESLELKLDTQLDQAQLRQVLEVWMMIYFLNGKFKIKGRSRVLRAHKVFVKNLKDWDNAQEWMHAIQVEVAPTDGVNGTENFTSACRVVEEAGRRYATYNKATCSGLKTGLLAIESSKAGRVRLNEFYKKGLQGAFNFWEKPDYLRTLGALDEADPKEPMVIVPNYVSARPNCLVTSTFYAICCRNECEDMMTALEHKIEAPTATPETVIDLVSAMSSETIVGPRTLPGSLVARLYSIADSNGGEVPMHGRLFAQWMHHSFPRECPYPHASGRTGPQTPDEWLAATGSQSASHTLEELQVRVDGDTCSLASCSHGEEARKEHALAENELPWDGQEELLQPALLKPTETEQAVTSEPAPPSLLISSLSPVAALASLLVFAFKMMSKRKAGFSFGGNTFNSDLMA